MDKGAWWATVLWVQRVRCYLGATQAAPFMETKRGTGTCPGSHSKVEAVLGQSPQFGAKGERLPDLNALDHVTQKESASRLLVPPAGRQQSTRCTFCSHTFTHGCTLVRGAGA